MWQRVILLTAAVMILQFLIIAIITTTVMSGSSSINATGANQKEEQTSWDTLIAGAIGALVGSAGTIIATIITSRYNLKNTIIANKNIIENDLKKSLHDQRMVVYADLIKRMEPLSIFDLSAELDSPRILQAKKELAEWYYEGKGGVLMTKQTEEKYVSFKLLLDAHDAENNLNTMLSPEASIKIKQLYLDFQNALRNELSID
jgi:hypothetical protein